MNAPISPFRATPAQIVFKDYELGKVYKTLLTFVNTDSVLRRMKYVPPKR